MTKQLAIDHFSLWSFSTGDLPQHLQVMINILRSEDRIKLVRNNISICIHQNKNVCAHTHTYTHKGQWLTTWHCESCRMYFIVHLRRLFVPKLLAHESRFEHTQESITKCFHGVSVLLWSWVILLNVYKLCVLTHPEDLSALLHQSCTPLFFAHPAVTHFAGHRFYQEGQFSWAFAVVCKQSVALM